MTRPRGAMSFVAQIFRVSDRGFAMIHAKPSLSGLAMDPPPMTHRQGVMVCLINLDRAPERRALALSQLAMVGLVAHRLAAVDGQRLGPDDLAHYDADATRRRFGRSLGRGEIGCYLSHVAALRRFLASDAETLLVVEDDLLLTPNFGDLLSAMVQALAGRSDWDVVNLGNRPRRWARPLLRLAQADEAMAELCVAHHFPALTTALLWSRAGAEAFLAQALPIRGAVDEVLKDWCIRRGRGLAFRVPPVRTSGAVSLIAPAPGEGGTPNTARRVTRGQRARDYVLRKQLRLWGNNLIALKAYLRSRPVVVESGPILIDG